MGQAGNQYCKYIPADSYLTANQGVGKVAELLGKQYREWTAGKADQEIQLLIHEKSTPRDPIAESDGSITKDYSHCLASLLSNVRPATKTMQLSTSFQLDNGGGSSHTCFLQNFTSRGNTHSVSDGRSLLH